MTELYDDQFFNSMRANSNLSGRIVVPMVQEIVGATSVLDVGCGVGGWAGAWLAAGLTDVVAVDGDYVNRDMLEIPADRFIAHDLTQPLDLGRKFDLVTSLEVAEHLPEDSAEIFVQSLVRHSDVILFSAAIPSQGGTGHINEQWPSYWARIFARARYRAYDPFRARIWENNQVEWWYRQNLLLFAAVGCTIETKLPPLTGPLDVAHPILFRMWSSR